jgi:hypothetical protein
LIIHVSYPGPEVQAFYIENMYLPLGTMLGVPLAYDVMPTLRSSRWPLMFLAGMMLFAVVRFVATSRSFTERLRWMRTLVTDANGQKLILPTASAPAHLLKMDWGTAYEVWLLSTSETGQSASMLLVADPKSFVQWSSLTAQFLGPWGPTPYTGLPPRYFRFKDTVSPYRIAQPVGLSPAQ